MTPDVFWQFRHELCHPLASDEDPLEEIRKTKGFKDLRKEQINKDEYEYLEDEDEVTWGR